MFKLYQKRSVTEIRPYIPGEDLTGINVAEVHTPQEGGKICQAVGKPEDRWYISAEYFAEHYVEVDYVEVTP